MHREFRVRYLERGRRSMIMGLPVQDMDAESLHALIGFLLEQAGDGIDTLLAQEAPLGSPWADPPKSDGLIEG